MTIDLANVDTNSPQYTTTARVCESSAMLEPSEDQSIPAISLSPGHHHAPSPPEVFRT